jgi:hypothetical protein
MTSGGAGLATVLHAVFTAITPGLKIGEVCSGPEPYAPAAARL